MDINPRTSERYFGIRIHGRNPSCLARVFREYARNIHVMRIGDVKAHCVALDFVIGAYLHKCKIREF